MESELKKLEKSIAEMRAAYWDGDAIADDSEYDARIERLRALDPGNPLLKGVEHGRIRKAVKVTHARPMLSLQKVYSKDDMLKWMRSVSRDDGEAFLVQPKYDGISCHYDHGRYSTRGDGHVGEDITSACRRMCRQETHAGTDASDYYGELLIRKSDFERVYPWVSRPDGSRFKNPRNAVAGIVGCDDCGQYADQGAMLTLVDYGMYSFEVTMGEAESRWDTLRSCIGVLDYPMDGIVVRLKDAAYADSLGSTDHHPRGAMAFKFSNERRETVLRGIEYGMGKESITAVALLDPVEMGGVTVSRASVPMKSSSLPCVMDGDFREGARVTVERAGDVIPHIVSIEGGGKAFGIDRCPFCGSPISVVGSSVSCTNDDCLERKSLRLYESLSELGVKYIGKSMVFRIAKSLMSGHMEVCLWNWMHEVPQWREKLLSLDGFGEANVRLVQEETERIRDTDLSRFVAAIGIPGVGTRVGDGLKERYRNDPRLLREGIARGELETLDGVGPILAGRIFEWFEEQGWRYDDLVREFRFAAVEEKSAGCRGSVCFTGKMRYPRSEMERIAGETGYVALPSVTRGLDLLVIADGADGTSSKCVRARKFGTKVISESEFLGMRP